VARAPSTSPEPFSPSVVIIDIRLLTMNGIEATKLIKFYSPFSVVIGLTVGEHDHTERAIMAAGATALLNKEEVFERLHACILDGVIPSENPVVLNIAVQS
jgi:DNA-binding NarL/FixJ family response regulator